MTGRRPPLRMCPIDGTSYYAWSDRSLCPTCVAERRANWADRSQLSLEELDEDEAWARALRRIREHPYAPRIPKSGGGGRGGA